MKSPTPKPAPTPKAVRAFRSTDDWGCEVWFAAYLGRRKGTEGWIIPDGATPPLPRAVNIALSAARDAIDAYIQRFNTNSPDELINLHGPIDTEILAAIAALASLDRQTTAKRGAK